MPNDGFYFTLTQPLKLMKHKVTTRYKKLLADTFTPVSIYLKLRDRFVNTILLESSDYHGVEDSFSYICCSPIAKFELQADGGLSQHFPDGTSLHSQPTREDLLQNLQNFIGSFEVEKTPFQFISNGLFGHIAYDAVQYFEDIDFDKKKLNLEIPLITYQAFRFVIAVHHFKNELYIFEHTAESAQTPEGEDIAFIESLIQNKSFAAYQFAPKGEEHTNFTDAEFMDVLAAGQKHCFRGDVFQIVMARRFWQQFSGDEFNVYRALRSINPSPYLFYFDYGNFKIFGSSPESQIVIKNGVAGIYPIAGTFRRTGNDLADSELAQKLLNDPKESAEHVMLVDLARNDLSRNSETVQVESFKEVQYYSHVIHLVSKVTGKLRPDTTSLRMVADTFPAGTLSGAPKHNAMQLIDQYENTNRSYYGGCIGYIGFDGAFNHAIMIRSFLSSANTLYYQAGAGVVAKSDLPSELQEVHNKLMALREAIRLAATL